jgi:hypothetical protein
VREASSGGRPEVRCVYAFTPEQWSACLAQENLRRGTPYYQAWKAMVDASVEVRPRDGRMQLSAGLRQLLAEPTEVSVLTIGQDRCEIWARADLDAYLRPHPSPAPDQPAR